ncbi:MAG: conjugal transfer protein TraX [Tissierellia bacterium]|nr:conjugal transfer protein TraX [Tissierellia bacterium]
MTLQVFNAFSLKVIMTILMVVDHIGQFFPNTPEYFRWIGRLVAPVFFFLATESYIHTSNKVKYIKRLYVSSLIMFVGSIILWIFFRDDSFIPNNIFFTLAVNLSLIYIREEKGNNSNNIIMYIALILLAFIAEGSFIATILFMLFHYLKHEKKNMSIVFIIVSLLFFPSIQWMQVFSLPFILMYNGKRGPNIKKFFYIFYPAHIWILFLLSQFITT